jgi:hypothetical protein
MLEHEISEAVESIFRLNEQNKYNVALGYFQGYSSEEVDVSGKRFADIKLHYRDANGDEIAATGVPVMFQGNQNTVDDFELASGDELIVLFSDRSLEQWNQLLATTPQTLSNKVKDSINHALCIPINTHHSYSTIALNAIDSAVGRRILVKPGKKIQIGNDTGTAELLKLFNDFLTEFKTLVGVTMLGGAVDQAGINSTGTNSLILVQLGLMTTSITAIQIALGTIAKV